MSQHRVLGVAGHIDHGKTALVKALTGTDTDRLPEEKKRGITIELGFARWDLGELAPALDGLALAAREEYGRGRGRHRRGDARGGRR